MQHSWPGVVMPANGVPLAPTSLQYSGPHERNYAATPPMFPAPMGRDQALQSIKRLLGRCSPDERFEIQQFLEEVGKVDLIARLPMPIMQRIFAYLTAEELCRCRLVSKLWNVRATDNILWKDHCVEHGILPPNHNIRTMVVITSESSPPIYHDLFRRALTTAKNWQLFRCRQISLHYHFGPILSMVIIGSQLIASGDVEGTIHLWNARRGQYLQALRPHKSHVACLATNGNILVSGSSDCTIAVHSLTNLAYIGHLEGHEGPVTALALGDRSTAYEDILFSGSVDASIRVWDTRTGNCIKILHGHVNTINSLIYVPPLAQSDAESEEEKVMAASNEAGWLISGSSDRTIYQWDLKKSLKDSPEVKQFVTEVHGPVASMALYSEWQDDSTALGIPENAYIRARSPLKIPPFIVCSAQYDSNITLWSLPALEPTYIESPIKHTNTIWDIATAPIHSKIITVSGDKTAQVWDLKSPRNVHILEGFDSAAVTCKLSQQEDLLCIGTETGSIYVFNFYDFC